MEVKDSLKRIENNESRVVLNTLELIRLFTQELGRYDIECHVDGYFENGHELTSEPGYTYCFGLYLDKTFLRQEAFVYISKNTHGIIVEHNYAELPIKSQFSGCWCGDVHMFHNVRDACEKLDWIHKCVR